MPALTRRAKDSAQSISTSRRTHKGWRSGDLRSRRSRETLRMRALSRASRPTIGCVNRSGRTRSVTTLSGAWTLGDRRRPFRDRTECMVAACDPEAIPRSLKGMKMLPRVLVLLALYSGSAATAFAADPLDEIRRSFTIGGKPIPPEIFADFGDAMMSDNRPIVVTIDANAAIDSNRYADPIKTNGRWVEQIKLGSGSFNGPETMSYEFRGATANGMLVFLAAWSGGGSGTLYYLHILDAASNRAFDEDGSTYSRLDLTLVRTYVLGDRWQGDVSISGNSVRIVTNASLGGHGVSPVTIEARRP
jgi:hypothetical protein